MNKFLVCAGINGSETALKKLLTLAEERKPDAILFAGGIADSNGNTPQKATFIAQFFEAIGKSGFFTIVIPGPNDAPLSEFLRAALNAEVIFPNIRVSHATPVSKGALGVSGVGGVITESEDVGGPVIKYSHTSAEYLLRTLWSMTKPVKVLLLSETPPGKLSSNGGNSFVREFIGSYHPSICVVAGDKEHRGFEQEAHGFVINPGMLSEGSAAWLDRLARKVEMIDL